MLSPDDAEVTARDTALPGLATILDPKAFAAALRDRLPGVRIGSAEEIYARYKPGKSCVIAYCLDVEGDDLAVYARAHRRESFARPRDMGKRARVAGPLGPGGLVLQDVAVSVYAFPNDRRIGSLALLGGDRDRARLLSVLVPKRPDLRRAEVRRLRYWPERRFVARLAGDGDAAVLKLYAENSYGASGRNASAFVSRGALRIAPCLGRSDELRALAFAWLPGRVLDELMVESDFDPASAAAAGAALAELHGQEAAGLQPRDAQADSMFLLARSQWVGVVRPDLAERVRSLALRLDEDIGRELGAECALHGDFTPRQVLVAADGVSILDLDDAARGDPVADLGVFISRLELAVIAARISEDRAQKLSAELLEGYRSQAGRSFDESRLKRHVAAELVRRLPGAFRRRGTGWMSLMAATLERAEEISLEA